MTGTMAAITPARIAAATMKKKGSFFMVVI
jgi:hypothetical protein